MKRFGSLSFLTILPLEFYHHLQQLGLASAQPLLPNPFRLSLVTFWRSLIPTAPNGWTLESLTSFTISLFLSPISLYFCMRPIEYVFETVLPKYARVAIPRPDNPDQFSERGATDEDFPISSVGGPVSKEGRYSRTVIGEITQDVRIIFKAAHDYCSSVGSGLFRIPLFHLFKFKPQLSSQPFPHSHHSDSHCRRRPGTDDNPWPSESHVETTRSGAEREVDATSAPDQPSAATPSPRLSLSSTDSENPQADNAVQVTTRAGSTDTLHMNVEVNGTAAGAPVYTNSFSASPRPTFTETVVMEQVDGAVIPSCPSLACDCMC